MFYRYKDEVVNLKEVAYMGKNFIIGQKTWLIQIATTVGSMSMKFPGMEERDRVFEEICKKMQDVK